MTVETSMKTVALWISEMVRKMDDPFHLATEIPGHVCQNIPGWWFGTFFIFPYIGNNHPN